MAPTAARGAETISFGPGINARSASAAERKPAGSSASSIHSSSGEATSGARRAWRLSDDGVPVATPRFSPDGGRVAWVSTRDGHAEVVVAPTEGGAADRLTWFGRPRCLVLGWLDR